MADRKYFYDKLIVLDDAQDSIIANTISPLAPSIGRKPLAMYAGIIASLKVLPNP